MGIKVVWFFFHFFIPIRKVYWKYSNFFWNIQTLVNKKYRRIKKNKFNSKLLHHEIRVRILKPAFISRFHCRVFSRSLGAVEVGRVVLAFRIGNRKCCRESAVWLCDFVVQFFRLLFCGKFCKYITKIIKNMN